MGYAMSVFGIAEWFLLLLWFAVLIGPLIYAKINETSYALSLTVSVLFGYVIQVVCTLFAQWGLVEYWVWSDFVLIPSRASSPLWIHTLFSAGFLHADALHVLGNTVILALIGIPLEQRLGGKRYLQIYFIGLFGGSFAWYIFNSASNTPSLGASGAAFGLLGAYLAGWPRDEIPFPLILIRKWPVTLIALLYFALEIMRAFDAMALGKGTNVAHMAHLGGFVATYLALPLVAKGGPYALGVNDGGPVGQSSLSLRMKQMKSSMISLNDLPDPWSAGGFELPKNVKETLQKLRDSGDEAETRIAWMEHLANQSECPVCGEGIGMVERNDGPTIQCSKKPHHFHWP
ncbi:rhomboid family intramembrane serine protease [Candidatus Poseidoniaceae archaeon]|nr:rhomboid family intramembrane serine protease [Candidatus Poseidoniaceae archaeon]|tara:strand:+ start:2168 stop:3202 length:1035 start_codon:yes stop_codon:yes gene_type:complete